MLRVFVIAAALVATVPATAEASARYASPTGSDAAPCTLQQPCDIVTAVNHAVSGDDITILPGSYAPTVALANADPLTIHGVAGQPRPVIASTAPYSGIHLGLNSSLSDVQLEMGDGSQIGLDATMSTVDRVIVRAPGSAACALHSATVLTNSVCLATGPGGAAARELTGAIGAQ